MKYLLDTSALLAHFRDEAGAGRVQELFDEAGSDIFVVSVTMTEFSRRLSVLGATSAEIERCLGDYRMLFRAVVSIDEVVALRAFAISESCLPRIPLVDSLIAAAAAITSATLVHRDSHFNRVPGRELVQEQL